jgi:hypothetical protein
MRVGEFRLDDTLAERAVECVVFHELQRRNREIPVLLVPKVAGRLKSAPSQPGRPAAPKATGVAVAYARAAS